jgi:hypothetical protein
VFITFVALSLGLRYFGEYDLGLMLYFSDGCWSPVKSSHLPPTDWKYWVSEGSVTVCPSSTAPATFSFRMCKPMVCSMFPNSIVPVTLQYKSPSLTISPSALGNDSPLSSRSALVSPNFAAFRVTCSPSASLSCPVAVSSDMRATVFGDEAIRLYPFPIFGDCFMYRDNRYQRSFVPGDEGANIQ